MFTIGNPLIDFSANVEKSIVQKTGYTIGEAFLLNAEEMSKVETIVAEGHGEAEWAKSPGGSGLNTTRVTKQILTEIGLGADAIDVSYAGRISKDEHGRELSHLCEEVGLKTYWQTEEADEEHMTGVCRSLIVHRDRTLLTHLGAASRLDVHIFDDRELMEQMNHSLFCYISAFVASDGFDVIKQIVALRAAGKVKFRYLFSNLASPFIVQTFTEQVTFLAVNSDMVFSNMSEFSTYLNALKKQVEVPPGQGRPKWIEELLGLNDEGIAWLKTVDLSNSIDVCKAAQHLFGCSCVVTDGKRKIVAGTGVGGDFVVCSPEEVDKTKIIDTNGAGDSFVGGFLARYLTLSVSSLPLSTHSLACCIKAGSIAAARCIIRSGCELAPLSACTEATMTELMELEPVDAAIVKGE